VELFEAFTVKSDSLSLYRAVAGVVCSRGLWLRQIISDGHVEAVLVYGGEKRDCRIRMHALRLTSDRRQAAAKRLAFLQRER